MAAERLSHLFRVSRLEKKWKLHWDSWAEQKVCFWRKEVGMGTRMELLTPKEQRG